jgi:uncharacterized protein YndB with AHSA1/START domain
MTEQTAVAVRRSITVDASPERAFEVFTTGFGSWWPLETHHIGATMATEGIIEPHAGGRWFERDADGDECEWGSVIAFEPPHRVVLGWHLTPEWKYDADPEKATEVEVTFTPAEGGTLVELEHRGFEKHGATGTNMRDAVAAPGGWADLLELYAKAF